MHFFRWLSLYARALFREAFFVLTFFYFIAFCIEAIRPGTVSFTLPLDVLLLVTVLFGIATVILPKDTTIYPTRGIRLVASTVISLVVAWYFVQQFSHLTPAHFIVLIVVTVVTWLVMYALFSHFIEDQHMRNEPYE